MLYNANEDFITEIQLKSQLLIKVNLSQSNLKRVALIKRVHFLLEEGDSQWQSIVQPEHMQPGSLVLLLLMYLIFIALNVALLYKALMVL